MPIEDSTEFSSCPSFCQAGREWLKRQSEVHMVRGQLKAGSSMDLHQRCVGSICCAVSRGMGGIEVAKNG